MGEPEVPFAILHIPHSSRVIPPEARRSIMLSDDALSAELLRMTDAFTDELFQLDARLARSIVFPVSRLVIDPERFLDDDAEPMSKRGMGLVYTRTSGGEVLRVAPDESARRDLIAAYYEPHHRRLAGAVDASLSRWGCCLVVDCHSFPSKPLPYELDQSLDRPDICLGTDDFHSPARLAEFASTQFRDAGFTIAINRPFAGALVPASYYLHDSRVMAIMVEVNRALYIDEAIGQCLTSFNGFASTLRAAIVGVVERARRRATEG